MTTSIQKDIEALKAALEKKGRSPYLGDYRESISRLLAHIDNLEARGIHSCHNDCKKDGCVNRRLRERIEALEKKCGAQAQVIKEALEWLDARDADIARAVLWRNKPSEGREG